MQGSPNKLLSWIGITNMPLRWVLVVPLVLQTVGAVTLVGYLSYRSGQQATENLALQLLQQTSERVSDRLDLYLHTPQQIVSINRLAVKAGTLDPNNREQLRQQLWQQMLLNPSLPANGFRNEAGIGIGYKRIISEDVRKKAEKLSGKMIPLGTVLFVENQQNQQQYFWIDSQGKPGQLVYQHNFQTSAWYHLAKNLGKQGWLPISLARILPLLQTQAVTPAYDPAGKLQGFFTVTYVVSEISLFLNDHQFSPTGQIFIIETGGELVATSFRAEASGLTLMNGKPARLSALNSQDQRTREITRQLIEQFGNFDQIKTPQQQTLTVANQRLFVQVTPYQNQEGLDWHVITVIPESDFMAEINQNTDRTVWLCFLILGLAILSGIGIANRCADRIRRLNQASLQLASGDLTQRLPTDSFIVEVKALAQSFNRMALQLHQSFNRLQNTLEESEEKFTTVFRTSPDAIAIVSWAEGRFLEINHRMIELYGYSPVEMIGRTAVELDLWVNVEERRQFRQLLETQGFTSNQEMKTRTKSGEIKIIIVSAEVCNLQGEDIVILMIRDITDRKQTQEALRQSEERFRQLAAASPGVIYTVVEDPNGPTRYEYLSPAFAEIHEIPVADVLQDASLAFNQIHPDDRDGYQQAVKDCIESEKPFQYEWRIITPSGKIKWIQANSRFEYRENGEIAWHGVVLDVSDRKQTEAQLRRTEQWLQQYSRQSPSSIYTLVLEPDGWAWFEYMSSAVEAIHEISLAQVLLNADLIINQIHPDDQASYQAAVIQSAETLELFSHEWRIITPSGQIKWLRANSQPQRRRNGAIAWHGVVEDITDYKQAQVALRQSELKFATIFRDSPQPAWIASLKEGCCIDINDSFTKVLGYTPAEVISKTCVEMQLWTNLSELEHFHTSLLKLGRIDNFEVNFRTKSGAVKTVLLFARVSRLNDQDCVIGVLSDISDLYEELRLRKQLELALQRSEAQIKNILNSTVAAIASMRVFKDNTWKIDHVSAGCERMTGYTAEELVEDNNLWINRIEPEDWLPLVPQIFTNIFAEKNDSYEYRFYHKDGSVLWISQTNNSCWDEAQQCWVLTAISVDITARKQTEMALQQNEARLKEAQRVAQLGNWEFDVATRESFWSEELFRITGLEPNQAEPSYNELLEMVPSGDREELLAAVDRAITLGISYQVEHRICRPDGSIRYLVSKGYAIFDEDQQYVTKLYGTALDITERKLIELALAAKTEELDRFFSMALDLLCIADTDGYFHRLNHQWEKALGYSLEELEGSKYLDYVHPDDLESTLNANKDLKNKKEILNFANRYRCKDGTYRWIEWRSLPVGNLVYAAARDITDRTQAEIALKQSETRFLEISESSPANIYIIVRRVDGFWYFEHISRAIEAIHEIPVEEVLNNANILLERIHPDDQAGYHAVAQRSMETLQPFQFEWRIITPSGKIKWLQGNSRPKLRENGDIAWYGVVIDVTDRKQVELALHLSEEKFKGAFDTITTGMALISLAGGFQEVNKTLCKMLGYSEEELLALRLEDIIDPLDDHVDLPLAEKMMEGEIPGYQLEKRFLHKEGYPIWGLFNIALMRDTDDRLLYLIAQITDISDLYEELRLRKQAELELQRQKDLRESIYNEATDALFIVDPNTLLIVDCNYRALQLFEVDDKAELIGLEGHTLQRRPFTPEELDEIAVQMQEKGFWTQEVEYITRKGNLFWGNIAAKPVQIVNESIHLVQVTDITSYKQVLQELQRAKEAAETANQVKSVFLANMSHELRTPLNVILGFTQLMNRSKTLNPDYQNYIKIMHSNGNYLLKLINDILEFSKIEAGKLTVKNQAINLFALLHTLRTMFSERVKSKKLEMSLDISPEVPQYIVIDAQKLQQVLINLIGNAIKFTEAGRVTLRVSLGNLQQYSPLLLLRFEVEDTGVGIAPQDLNQIFEAFVQASSSQQAKEGTGLGLSISRKLVELMGGEMTVSSRIGVGSIFGFTIPVQRVTASSVQPQQPKRQVTGLVPGQPSYRILVVDDRLENRLLLVQLLEQVGLEVEQAASGEEAVTLWRQWHPHLIWMDLRMPEVDGYEATQRIRAEELKRQDRKGNQPTIIIALTAQASVSDGLRPDEGYRAQALTVGCNDYISKPFQAETLFSKMAEYLGIRYTYREEQPILPDDQTLGVEDNLTLEHLAVMPHDWVLELYEATRTCKQQTVQKLIQHIPAQHSFLARSLAQLNQDFDFEKIMQLTQQYLGNRE